MYIKKQELLRFLSFRPKKVHYTYIDAPRANTAVISPVILYFVLNGRKTRQITLNLGIYIYIYLNLYLKKVTRYLIKIIDRSTVKLVKNLIKEKLFSFVLYTQIVL